jgi:hypothetical protein
MARHIIRPDRLPMALDKVGCVDQPRIDRLAREVRAKLEKGASGASDPMQAIEHNIPVLPNKVLAERTMPFLVHQFEAGSFINTAG